MISIRKSAMQQMLSSTRNLHEPILSAVAAIKHDSNNELWSHYIDHHRVIPNVRITEPSHMYLNFHVGEYPTSRSFRALAVEVSATWLCKHELGSSGCNVST